MNIPKWLDVEKQELLRNAYSSLSKIEVGKLFPNHDWRSLQNIANKLKIKREYSEIRKGNIENLFNRTIESFYWIGLIVTDGTISKDGELKVELSNKDSDYLDGLAKFLNSSVNNFPNYTSFKNHGGTCRVKIKDIKNGRKLRELLKITEIKTYNPVSIDFISCKIELIAFLGGVIDGDGTINKKGYISVDMHRNYYDFLTNLGDMLKAYGIINKFSVLTYKDMCRLVLPSESSLIIKNILLEEKLPIMNRKWSRISDIKIVKNYLLEHKETILKMRLENKKLKDICKAIDYKSIGTLSKFIKDNK